ncbi:MAG TPA: CorA family divalent cation transporter [Gaiellaceae bacterium]|nr:CorA family divalent cation transporter [Gaiellaceae bacterium]
MATALLFERDDVDRLEDWAERLPRLGRSAILWIDLERPTREEIEELAAALDLERETAERLADGGRGAQLSDHGAYLHVTAWAPSDAQHRELQRVACLVSERWIVSVHEGPVAMLEAFRERATGSGQTGRLDGPEFLANLLEWVLASYLAAFEEIEKALEEVDARAMRGEARADERLLGRLVQHRREVGRLRRALVSHRELLLALARPELEALGGEDAAERFAALRDRLEQVVQAARDSRDAVTASFDVLIASTGQRTNDIMKVLTLASVLLLPGSLVAGILGMNFRLGVFETEAYFWVVVAGMAAVALGTVLVARARRWI